MCMLYYKALQNDNIKVKEVNSKRQYHLTKCIILARIFHSYLFYYALLLTPCYTA